MVNCLAKSLFFFFCKAMETTLTPLTAYRENIEFSSIDTGICYLIYIMLDFVDIK